MSKFLTANNSGWKTSSNRGVSAARSVQCSSFCRPEVVVRPLSTTGKALTSSSGTIDFRKMIEDAVAIENHVISGGKPSEIGATQSIQPTGLFDNRVKQR